MDILLLISLMNMIKYTHLCCANDYDLFYWAFSHKKLMNLYV